MCLITFHWQDHPRYPLIVASNRDEVYNRPTEAAHFWPDHPYLLAGRDLLQQGTWLGITKQGKFAALTNYRDSVKMATNKRSRGDLVKNYLTSDMHPVDYLTIVHDQSDEYTGFNLIVGTTDELYYYNNIEKARSRIPSGTHSLSNRFLNTPWQKVIKSKSKLRSYAQTHNIINTDLLFHILLDAEQAPDDQLPDTGIGKTLEKQLSSLFIQTPSYGTRSSTVLLIDHDLNVTFIERTYDQGKFTTEEFFNFTIKNA